MIKLLVRLFIKDYNNVEDPKVREKYGILGGILGIICNIILFVIKLIIGFIMNSIAILSDAFNNLTDMFSSGIGIISAKLSSKKPDKKHPFGHGRFEYIATLIVSFIIIMVGFELFSSSINKIIDGIKGQTTPLNFSITAIIILSISILIKIWMAYYNHYLGKKINSSMLKATTTDSLSDVLTSSAVIITTLIANFLLKDYYFYLDGGIGIIVAIIICINGIKIIASSTNDILGKGATKEEIDKINSFLLSDSHILGTHDLIVHDYGPGRKMVTVHCEVDENENFRKIHEIIDSLDNKAYEQLNLQLVIHMDPINTTSDIVKKLNIYVKDILSSIDSSLSFHDLRITDGDENINIIFDLVVPFDYSIEKIHNTVDTIQSKLKEKDKRFSTVIKIDHLLVDNSEN